MGERSDLVQFGMTGFQIVPQHIKAHLVQSITNHNYRIDGGGRRGIGKGARGRGTGSGLARNITSRRVFEHYTLMYCSKSYDNQFDNQFIHHQ